MKAWKRVVLCAVSGAALLGSAFAQPAFAQITVSDIRAAKQKYLQEFLRCSDMSSDVKRDLDTPAGSNWTKDFPGEWYLAANLTRATGCSHNSDEVQARLRQALDFIKTKTPITRTDNNWWHLDIGVPRALAEALLVGGQNVPSDLLEQMKDALGKFIQGQHIDEKEGANTVWSAWARLVAAFYFEDVNYAQSAYDLMSTATSQGGHNHIPEDWSYFFHHSVLNMHYGGQHLSDFADYLKLSEGTGFSLQSREILYDRHRRTGLIVCLEWLKNFLQWIYYKDGLADPYTVTKFPHWQSSYGGRIQRVSGVLKKTSYAQVKPYSRMLDNIAAGAMHPIGARAFPQSRYLVVRRSNFFASLMMANLAEPHMEASTFAPIFGAVNIVDPSSYKKWEDDNILAQPYLLLNAMTVPMAYEDATHQADTPGTPNPGGHSGREHESEMYNMLRNWGYYGVSTLGGYYGMGAEQLTGQGGEFSFRRAWFFLDDEIVCTGSGITSNNPSLGGIRTFLYNFAGGDSFQSPEDSRSVPLSAGNDVGLGSLTWLHHSGMGYFFPTAAEVRAQGLGASSRVYLNHGDVPSEASFAAVLLPTFSQNQTQNYAANPNVEVIQCDRAAHIIRHKNSNVTGIAAFEPITTTALKTNFSGYVLYQNTGGKFSLSLYNPFLEEELASKLGEKWGNPMFDAEADRGQPTYNRYKLEVPFRLHKGTGEGMDLFELTELAGARSEVQLYLRVYRKFEMAGTHNADGSVTIDTAWVAWNDAASKEVTTTTPSASRPPVARPGGPYIIRAGGRLDFNGGHSHDPDGGNIMKHQWSFGDGATATGESVSHQYAAAGAYQARLEVTDDEGENNQADFVVTIQPQPSAGENIRVLVSGDDKYEMYINGARIGSNASWLIAEEYVVPLLEDKNVIAIKAENWDQAGAVLAEVYAKGGFWPSGAKWKVSLAEENGWQQIDFNDANWSVATSHGLHGVAQPWAQFQNVGGISTNKGVHWIWSADKRQEHVVYLRFLIPPGADVQPPTVPTGLRAESL